MAKPTETEIPALYNEIKLNYDKYLKNQGVKLPNLRLRGSYTRNALVLIYLYKNLGKKVNKGEITIFLEDSGYPTNDMQQARHLGAQSGWYILSGTRRDYAAQNYELGSGDYALVSVTEPHPSFNNASRSGLLNSESWEEIKKQYGHSCATCGSVEGEPNRYHIGTKTTLEKGHMDPTKQLTLDNCIPQCSTCNRPDRNYFIYDRKGRVKAIADPKFILKSSTSIQKQCLEFLIREHMEFTKKVIKEMDK
ncbi:MAG TPA: hypothetical protein VFC73_07525 [Syntrophomonadaceae bacterium]|nr:hypothetical protein [Syntrophomonadaceae bacterium]